jgi:hypothetical protein
LFTKMSMSDEEFEEYQNNQSVSKNAAK